MHCKSGYQGKGNKISQSKSVGRGMRRRVRVRGCAVVDKDGGRGNRFLFVVVVSLVNLIYKTCPTAGYSPEHSAAVTCWARSPPTPPLYKPKYNPWNI